MTVLVAMVGGILAVPERCRIGDRGEENKNMLVAVITAMTAAALISLAFLADKFSATDGSLSSESLEGPGPLTDSLRVVLVLLPACISGLLCAVVGLVILGSSGARRWAGACLAVSSLAAVALFPAVIVLILAAADAAATATP